MRVEMHPGVFAFLCGVALATTLLSGAIPMFRTVKADLTEPLKTDCPGATGPTPGWFSRILLTGQIMFSSVALLVAALMVNGLLRSRQVESGFPAEEVYVSSLALDGQMYNEANRRSMLRRGLVTSLERQRTISGAALSTGLPGLFAPLGRLSIEGIPDRQEERGQSVLTFGVTDSYFDVFDISFEIGRNFRSDEGSSTEPVAIVSRDFVRRHLTGSEVLGRRIRVAGVSPDSQWARIVGVVSDVLIYDAYRDQRLDWVYFPMAQVDARDFYVFLRGAGNSTEATRLVQHATWELDPALPLGGTVANDGAVPVIDILRYVRRLFETAGTLALLGGLGAVLVASLGLYGVMAYEVRRRLREIGIRLALGAGRGRVQRLVLKDAIKRFAPGLGLGIVLAYLIAPLFGVFLSGTDAHDPLVFGSTCVGYILVSLAATLVPASRAASLEPSQVLRSD
jgi:hypothetical protein